MKAPRRFDPTALWLFAAPVSIVLVLFSTSLFLLGVAIFEAVWLLVVHEQRDTIAQRWARDAFNSAGLKRKNRLLTVVNVRLLKDNRELTEEKVALVARLAEVIEEHADCPAPVALVTGRMVGAARAASATRDGGKR